MKRLVICLALTAFLQAAASALPAWAEEEEGAPTTQEISQAENEPPVIPHWVADTVTGKECLVCHEKGKDGAPQTPHPERLTCTQCHVRSELVQPKAAPKTKKKK